MKIIKGLNNIVSDIKENIVAMGVFDGVHLGHQKIIKKTVIESKKNNTRSLVITFQVHPKRFLNSSKIPLQITSLEHKLNLFEKYSIDNCLILPAHKEIFSMTSDKFIKEVLVGLLGIKGVVIGKNFTFGKNGHGDLKLLKEKGKEFNYYTWGMDLVELENMQISSSNIRSFIKNGNIEYVSKSLGRDFSIFGSLKYKKTIYKNKLIDAQLKHTQEILPCCGKYQVYIFHKNIKIQGIAFILKEKNFSQSKNIYLSLDSKEKYIFSSDIELFFKRKI